jgi:NitT/TauT family transport system ATP-binding protein
VTAAPLAAGGAAAPFVDFRHVWLAYEGQEAFAVEDITLSIAQGEFVAIVGPSGCGKSTFMKLATGLKPPSRGEIDVEGVRVTRTLKIAGMAFQNPTMLPWLTAIDNVLVPLKIVQPYRSRFKQQRAEYEERARALFKTVGLSGFEKRHPWQLSGGMQQRASLCRALIHEPELLLLDEPFGALDAFTREDLWATLQALCMTRRPTVILVTHDLREAVYLADRIFVMSARPGRVIAAHEVRFPRPRTLDMTFSEEFVALNHALRNEISDARTEVLA